MTNKKAPTVGMTRAAEAIGVSRQTLHRWVSGGLPLTLGGGKMKTATKVPAGTKGRHSHRFDAAYIQQLAATFKAMQDAEV